MPAPSSRTPTARAKIRRPPRRSLIARRRSRPPKTRSISASPDTAAIGRARVS